MWIFNKYWSWVKEQVIPPDDHPDSGRTLIFDLSNFRRQYSKIVQYNCTIQYSIGENKGMYVNGLHGGGLRCAFLLL